MKPTGRNILVKPEVAETTQGGLFLPESVQKTRKVRISVVAWGSKCEEAYEVGQTLHVNQNAGMYEVEENGVKFYVVHETNVLGVS